MAIKKLLFVNIFKYNRHLKSDLRFSLMFLRTQGSGTMIENETKNIQSLLVVKLLRMFLSFNHGETKGSL